MARANKKTKVKTSSRRAAAPKAKALASKATRAAKGGTSAPAGEPGSDVEARWNEYWQCRTALEAAVTAVREAQTRLAEAKAEEAERRKVFDQTKNALRDLLEVEPASNSAAPSQTRNLFDAGTRLGVVEADDADDESDEAEDG